MMDKKKSSNRKSSKQRQSRTITIHIGNKAKQANSKSKSGGLAFLRSSSPQPHTEWTLYIKEIDTNTIEKVRIHLHPSFQPSVIELLEAPFELNRVGWGVFEIPIEITFKGSLQTHQFIHELQFDEPDKFIAYTLPMSYTAPVTTKPATTTNVESTVDNKYLLIDQQLSQVNCVHRSRVVMDLMELLDAMPSFKSSVEVEITGFSTDNRQVVMVAVTGSIPFFINSEKTDVPIIIYIPESYPNAAPLVRVLQSEHTKLASNHTLFDANGICNLSAVWSTNSSLLQIVNKLSEIFSDYSPIDSEHSSTDFSLLSSSDITISADTILDSLSINNKSLTSRFQLVKKIGRGGMGHVFHCRDVKTSSDVAIKKVYCETVEELTNAMKEVWPVRQLKHDNLVEYRDVYFEENSNSLTEPYCMCIVMDYFNEGDLQSDINRRLATGQHYTESELLQILLQISSGLTHLHSSNLIHRDLKPLNIFKRGSNLKLGDFGLAKNINDSTARTQAGTPKYMAPELFRRKSYHLEADVWSFGVLSFELMTLQLDTVMYMEVFMNPTFYENLEQQMLKLEYSERLVKLVLKCLSKDTTVRPTATQILQELQQILETNA